MVKSLVLPSLFLGASAFSVDTKLAAKLAANGGTEAMIVLDNQASLDNLELATSMTRAQKREAVAQYLKKHAVASQKSALDLLQQHNVEATSFWIHNVIHASNLTAGAADALQKSGEGMSLRTVGGFYRPPPQAASGVSAKADGTVEWNVAKVRADEAWSTADGTGVVLATLDGGVSYKHEALIGNYRGNDGNGNINHDYNWKDWAYKNKSPLDTDGHGTNVQGIATGSKESGVGIAPGAKWITGKMCNFAGYCDRKWTLSAAQWAMCPEPLTSTEGDCSKGADVVSCSWGEDDATEPYLEKAVSAWLKAGMVPVFAVGNSGPQCKTSVSPADYEGVIGVGATYKDDGLTSYSSKGPGANGTDPSGVLPYNAFTPSIVAPGQGIRGPKYDSDKDYSDFSGTSQACPHVAGAAAILLSKYPKLSPQAVADALHKGASQNLKAPEDGHDTCGNIEWNTFPNYIYGYGRLDIVAALSAASKMVAEEVVV